MLFELTKPGVLENVIIKTQHNCMSDKRVYSGSFIPIVHEYVLLVRKDAPLAIPLLMTYRVQGDMRDMTGHWKKDGRYGLQFEMESYEEIVGSDKSSVVAYLSSGMIPGIGSVLAERIYNTFGEQTLEVLDQDPTRVAEVPGINKKKCDQFCTAYMETRSARKLINMLASFNISAPQAIKLRQQLGTEAQALLTQFPYMVFERDLIDFETADQLAQANGIPKNAPERLDAGLLYTLKLAEHDGHLCMHKEAFVRRAVNLLHAPLVTWKGVAQRAFEMIQAERLTLYND